MERWVSAAGLWGEGAEPFQIRSMMQSMGQQMEQQCVLLAVQEILLQQCLLLAVQEGLLWRYSIHPSDRPGAGESVSAAVLWRLPRG